MAHASKRLFLVCLVLLASARTTAEDSEGGESGGLLLPRHRSRRDLSWNAAIDVIIRHGQSEILNQQKCRIPLRDINDTFVHDLDFIKVQGVFKATDGWVEDFSSLGRVGDVNISREGSEVLLTAVLKAGVLRLGYDHYEAQVWRRKVNGSLNATVGRNAIRFVLKFELLETECKTTLEEIEVVEFGGLQVDVTGFGALNFVVEKVVQWVLEKRRLNIFKDVENLIRTEIEKGLMNFECDEYANLLMVSL